MKLGRHGFSLLEAVISIVLLSLVATAVHRMQLMVARGTQVALTQDSISRALYLAQGEIVKDDRFLPAQEYPPPEFPGSTKALDAALGNPDIAMVRCFDRSGSALPDCDHGGIFFKITYVKFRQPDMSRYVAAGPENELNRIPLGLYHMRVDFAFDKAGVPQKFMYFNRLVVTQLAY